MSGTWNTVLMLVKATMTGDDDGLAWEGFGDVW